MSTNVLPILHTVSVKALRPTQMTVGMREVALKRKDLQKMTTGRTGTFLGGHSLPAVIGPKGRYHIVDHHHLALALRQESIEQVLVTVICDLSALDKDAFLTVLDNRAWMHPFDASGKRRPYGEIPKTLDKLSDDPFRSLAGEVRRLGGYAKDTTPFAEFLWADFFRRRMDARDLKDDFDKAAGEALQLARRGAAGYLPGWSGPDQ
ncbi:ParB-like protein [Mesorhizobium sp. PUT5]|uniref:ParB-like protein n=1 Tax=Mesorhizobium sp. PUT5 TaxID=3454629 RepID=UPI003FA4C1EA